MKTLYLHIVFIFCAKILFAQQASVFEYITTANGLPSNYVFCTTEDSNGFIWAGTDKGLCYFNGAVWQVWDVDKGLPGNYINTVISDNHNGLWLGIAEKGLYHFDIETKKTVLVTNSKPNISISTSTNANGDLLCYSNDLKNKKITNWIFKQKDFLNPIKLNENKYYHDKIDYDDTLNNVTHRFLLIGDKEEDFNPTNKKIVTHFINITKSDKKNYAKAEKNYLINKDWFYYFSDDGKHDSLIKINSTLKVSRDIYTLNTEQNLYVAIAGAGFYNIDKKTKQIKNYLLVQGLTNENITNIYKDKQGNIYLSTLGGGIHALQTNVKLRYTPKDLPLRDLQYNNGFYYGMANGSLYKLSSSEIISTTFIRKDALSFYISSDTLMVGSFEGLHHYHYANNNITLLNTFPIGAGISSIIPLNTSWIISTYGSGFLVVKDYKKTKNLFGNLPFANIEKTISLQNGYAALSYEDGFFTCNKNFESIQHFNTKNGLLSNFTNVVHNYKDTLWVGGKNGVSLLVNNKVVKTFSFNEGFKGNVVKAIFTSSTGKVWVISNKYLHTYNNGMLEATGNGNVNIKKENIIEALYDSTTDKLFLSTSTGISVLQLSELSTTKKDIEVTLQKIIIDEKTLKSFNDFELQYDANKIAFYFKPLDNLLLNPTIFYCKLNDNPWELVTDSLTISYNKLRSGNYTLYTKSINADGKESETKAITSFNVIKPWWQRWWSIVLYTVGLIVVIGYIAQYFYKKKQEKLLQKLAMQKELETERHRISRDLHDNMGAYTSALIANVQQLKNKTGDTDDVKKMQSNAEQILASLRETIWVLNNKEISVQEFSDGFKNYCFKILKNFEQLSFSATEKIENNKMLSSAMAIHLNKIMQEAVQNIIKHANATAINYTIESNTNFEITIADNGVGFDETKVIKGNGLDNMEWRAKEAGVLFDISIVNDVTTLTIKSV